MGLFSKLFGAKPAASAAAAQPESEAARFSFATEPSAAYEQCLAEAASIVAATEDHVERAMLLARVTSVRAARKQTDATLQALVEAVSAGLKLGNLQWALEFVAETLRLLPDRAQRVRTFRCVQR